MARHEPTNGASTADAAREARRERMRALGSRGGTVRAERARKKRADAVAAFVVETREQLRAFLVRGFGEVDSSEESASIKATARARLAAALDRVDGIADAVRERDELRIRVTELEHELARARHGGDAEDAQTAQFDRVRRELEEIIARRERHGERDFDAALDELEGDRE